MTILHIDRFEYDMKQINDGIYVTLFPSFRIKYDEKIEFENKNLESCDMLT